MIDFGDILGSVLHMERGLWIAFFLGFIIVVSASLVMAFRYRSILSFFNEKISFIDSFNIVSISQFISYLSPFRIGSILIKPLMTKMVSSVSYKKSVLASMFEQIYDISWQILLLPVLMYVGGKKYFYGNIFIHLAVVLISLALVIFMIANLKEVIGFLWRMKFIAPKFFKEFLRKKRVTKERTLQFFEQSKSYLQNRKMLFEVTIITFIHFVLSALVLEVFLVSFNYYVPFYMVLAGFWTSVIIGRLSGLPLGLGARDISLGAMLVVSGVSLTDSVKLVLLVRLVIMMTLFLFGIFFWVYNSRKIKNFWELFRKIKGSKNPI